MPGKDNVDVKVAEGFGDEWSRFDQHALSAEERGRIFSEYFAIFPWERISTFSVGADFGCGSGRWAAVVAPRVGSLHCVDASAAALESAKRNLAAYDNCAFSVASLEKAPIPSSSLDFAYSLGVLHHVPDSQAGLDACVDKLKAHAPFLLYMYYRFDNRPRWYRGLWMLTEAGRFLISRLPFPLRYAVSQIIAGCVYWPLGRLAGVLGRAGLAPEVLPLSYYRDKSFYVMRTDALDRFGTRLEKRFTKPEIEQMMHRAGLERVTFSSAPPYWCAVGYKRQAKLP